MPLNHNLFQKVRYPQNKMKTLYILNSFEVAWWRRETKHFGDTVGVE